jgi:hypothetical protein
MRKTSIEALNDKARWEKSRGGLLPRLSVALSVSAGTFVVCDRDYKPEHTQALVLKYSTTPPSPTTTTTHPGRLRDESGGSLIAAVSTLKDFMVSLGALSEEERSFSGRGGLGLSRVGVVAEHFHPRPDERGAVERLGEAVGCVVG